MSCADSTAGGSKGEGAGGGSGRMKVASGDTDRSFRFTRTLGGSRSIVLGTNGGEYWVPASTIRLTDGLDSFVGDEGDGFCGDEAT